MNLNICIVTFILVVRRSTVTAQSDPFLNETFPSGFLWGAATSAYQIEGGWKADGEKAMIVFSKYYCKDEVNHHRYKQKVSNSFTNLATI